jgi:hypothetical protein
MNAGLLSIVSALGQKTLGLQAIMPLAEENGLPDRPLGTSDGFSTQPL